MHRCAVVLLAGSIALLANPASAAGQIAPREPILTQPVVNPTSPSTLVLLNAAPAELTLATGAAGSVTVSGQNVNPAELTGVRVLTAAGTTTSAVRASWTDTRSTGRGLRLNAATTAPEGTYRVQAQRGTKWLDVPVTIRVAKPAPVIRQARYRLTLNGFQVSAETWDHMLELDGKRDEVFFTANVKEEQGATMTMVDRQPTPTYGDVNGFPARLRAGTASTQGGLRTGDGYPTSTPWKRNTSPQALRLPWVLWEGTLKDAQSRVTVMPVVWEWDPGVSSYREWIGIARDVMKSVTEAKAFQDWVKASDAAAADAAKKAAEAAGAAYKPEMGAGAYLDLAKIGVDVAYKLASNTMVGKEETRQIGSKVVADEKIEYVVRPLVLTYNIAELLLSSYSEFGPGIWMVTYYDDNVLRGKYHLYFQLERIP